MPENIKKEEKDCALLISNYKIKLTVTWDASDICFAWPNFVQRREGKPGRGYDIILQSHLWLKKHRWQKKHEGIVAYHWKKKAGHVYESSGNCAFSAQLSKLLSYRDFFCPLPPPLPQDSSHCDSFCFWRAFLNKVGIEVLVMKSTIEKAAVSCLNVWEYRMSNMCK